MGRRALPFWQRLFIVVATMLLTSFVAGLIWHGVFRANIPAYLSGLIGGITAVPVWELLKRVEFR